jgi:nucleotide-binding universal stress UspA family protein
LKILLAVDGSPCSDAAIVEIGRTKWPAGSEIKVLSAFDLPLPANLESLAIPQDHFEELNRTALRRARSIIDRAVERLKSQMGVSFDIKGVFLPGPPRVAIENEAARWHADLTVVGSKGYRDWERFLMGSVTKAVASFAKFSEEKNTNAASS